MAFVLKQEIVFQPLCLTLRHDVIAIDLTCIFQSTKKRHVYCA
jgi:hypothetical protein